MRIISTQQSLLITLKKAHIILLWIQSPSSGNIQQALHLLEKLREKKPLLSQEFIRIFRVLQQVQVLISREK